MEESKGCLLLDVKEGKKRRGRVDRVRGVGIEGKDNKKKSVKHGVGRTGTKHEQKGLYTLQFGQK